MTKRDTTDLAKLFIRVIERRARSAEDGAPVTEVSRRAYEDLAVVLVPLLSQAGFDALVARAFQLARREYPAGEPAGGDAEGADTFVQVDLWLDRQDRRNTIKAASAMFAAFAELLTTLIGESLTTRYLRKAWPDGFSAERSRRTRA